MNMTIIVKVTVTRVPKIPEGRKYIWVVTRSKLRLRETGAYTRNANVVSARTSPIVRLVASTIRSPNEKQRNTSVWVEYPVSMLSFHISPKKAT